MKTRYRRAGYLKKSRGVLRKAVRLRYAFIKQNSDCWPVRWLCRMLEVHPSGYYGWHSKPHSKRDKANQRLTGLIKQFWLESGGVYGYRKIHSDLREVGDQVVDQKIQLSKEIRDRIQNHAFADVSSKHYDRWEYLPEKLTALQKWEQWCLALKQG